MSRSAELPFKICNLQFVICNLQYSSSPSSCPDNHGHDRIAQASPRSAPRSGRYGAPGLTACVCCRWSRRPEVFAISPRLEERQPVPLLEGVGRIDLQRLDVLRIEILQEHVGTSLSVNVDADRVARRSRTAPNDCSARQQRMRVTNSIAEVLRLRVDH